jgi:hypothetical protein
MYVKFLGNKTIANKRFIITILALVGIYFLLLPLFWPEPKIALTLSSADNSQDISEPTVTVHAWHSNIALFNVKGIFNVDKSKNKGQSAVTRNFLPERNLKKWDAFHTFGINRLTWPRVYNYTFELPIEELRSKTDSDYVTGRIYIKVRYPNVNKGFVRTTEASHVERVNIGKRGQTPLLLFVFKA